MEVVKDCKSSAGYSNELLRQNIVKGESKDEYAIS